MQALRSTQFPSSMINPLCSAMAMNSLGGISPRVGCVHDHFTTLVDDRLVYKPQAVVLDRLAQIGFEQLATREIGIHSGVVDASAVATFVLRAIERHIGVAHDVGCGPALVVDHRNSERGADDDVLSVDDIGSADRTDDALRQRHHLFAVARDR
jgi:hypothetical protein